MCPSRLYPALMQSVIHQRVTALARQLMGEDMALDFDMLIDKPPHTHAPTPWHQDEAYWINMPDKRAVSCWLALDDVVKENGCMWFIPKSHQAALRSHVQTGQGGALQCQATEAEAIAAEMQAGSCTFHHGRTVHYARGNSTDRRRRAFITNFRPEDMITYERERGFDHLGAREVRQ
ncbi:MAG: phytanoyl-CoA dioxygenase family protein [Saprospiraceae bacterium]